MTSEKCETLFIHYTRRKLVKAGRRSLKTNNDIIQQNSQGDKITLDKKSKVKLRGPREQSFPFQIT